MVRAFVAIRPPESVLDAIAERVASVALRGGRTTTRDQWHITVQFLGDDVDVDEVASALQSEPFDVGPGEVAFGGAGPLGARRRSRILMVGVREGADWVRALASEVEARLTPIGYGRDDRQPVFVPHLTLARFREPTDLRRLAAEFGPDPVGPSWEVEEMVLYESELRPEGARHTARTRVSVRH
ncbi:MAG: 2,3-cyclic 3-phosphodiesterase [Actinomycetota bacterium]|nr:2,3-cyclic 3-phosphodiesterase [Actinomycetota bacterium]